MVTFCLATLFCRLPPGGYLKGKKHIYSVIDLKIRYQNYAAVINFVWLSHHFHDNCDSFNIRFKVRAHDVDPQHRPHSPATQCHKLVADPTQCITDKCKLLIVFNNQQPRANLGCFVAYFCRADLRWNRNHDPVCVFMQLLFIVIVRCVVITYIVSSSRCAVGTYGEQVKIWQSAEKICKMRFVRSPRLIEFSAYLYRRVDVVCTSVYICGQANDMIVT